MIKRIVAMFLMLVMSFALATVVSAAPDTDKVKALEEQIIKEISEMSGCSEVRRIESFIKEKPNEIKQNMEQTTDSYVIDGIQPFWTPCCDPSTMNVVIYYELVNEGHNYISGNHCEVTIYAPLVCSYCDSLHGFNVVGGYTHLHY